MSLTPQYSVVALKGNDDIASTVRTFAVWTDAIGYLLHNLDRRPNLDIFDASGEHVAWEFGPPQPTDDVARRIAALTGGAVID